MSIRAILVGAAIGAFTLGALMVSGAQAQDYSQNQSSAYSASSFSFDGLYLGATVGGLTGNRSAGTLGAVVGANFALQDALLGGLEFQADAVRSGETSYNVLTLGKLGVLLTSDIMLYADLGVGWIQGNGGYALGGGAEYALGNNFSVRGEILGLSEWGSGPGSAKATAGIVYHMQ